MNRRPVSHEEASAHDPLIKQILRTFLPDFLNLFYPQIAERLDLTTVEFRDKEEFTDLPKGEQRTADVVAQLRTRDGQPELLLIHVEAQRRRGGRFPYRVFEYWALLRLRRQMPVLSIALYLSPGAGGIVTETYTETLFGETQMVFTYHAVGLPDLSASDYETNSNRLGPTFSAIMKGAANKVERKLRILEQRPILDCNPAERALLIAFIDNYLALNDEEEAEFERRISVANQVEVREMLTQYEQRGLEKGRAEGITQGIRKTLIDLLEVKFGRLPASVISRLSTITKEDELSTLTRRVLTANSLEELGLLSPQ